MGFLKWLLWTACAVGLGVYLASGDIGGRTPLQHLQRSWKQHGGPTQVERLGEGLKGAYQGARGALTGSEEATAPREHITAEDRAAVNRIIAQKK